MDRVIERGMPMTTDVEHAAIVTGSATGIGAAIALALSDRGWGAELHA